MFEKDLDNALLEILPNYVQSCKDNENYMENRFSILKMAIIKVFVHDVGSFESHIILADAYKNIEENGYFIFEKDSK